MLLRLSTLATGRTGVREEVVHDVRRAAERGHHPGRARVRQPRLLRRPRAAGALRAGADGRGPGARRRPATLRDAADALAAHGIAPVVLRREGGPRADQRHRRHARACSCWPIDDLRLLLTTADITAAMSVEGLLGTDDVFADDLQALRPHPGQAASAANLRTLLRRQRDHGTATAARSAPASRTPTRCAAPRRSPAAPATPSTTPRWSPGASWPPPSTTRW